MKAIKHFITALLPIAAASLLFSCNNEERIAEKDNALVSNEGKKIAFTVTAGYNGTETRATIAEDNELKLVFQEGDKLQITGTDISGTLTLKSGAGTESGTFSGELTYTGEGTPADDLELSAKLIGVNASTDKKNISATLEEAVQKYSLLIGTGTFASKSFSLKQQCAFVRFNVLLRDGTTITSKDSERRLGIMFDGYLYDEDANTISREENALVTTGSSHPCFDIANNSFSFVVAFEPGYYCVPKVWITISNKSEGPKRCFLMLYSDQKAWFVSDKELDDTVLNNGNYAGRIIQLNLGKVYTVNRIAGEREINLNDTYQDVQIENGLAAKITGTSTSRNITVGAGATVTLSDASFNRLIINGDATINVTGTNKLNFDASGSAVTIASGSTVTFKGTGSLTSNTKWSSGAGGLTGDGTLIVDGPTITMNGNDVERGGTAPGISVRNFTLLSGKVSAWGGNNYYYSENRNNAIYASGNILIEGGTIEANGNHGMRADGNMTINGGIINATGSGDYSGYNSGLSAGGKLRISGGMVTAKGAMNSPGIGDRYTCGDIEITRGTVTAIGGSGAAGIGTGSSSGSVCGNITISQYVMKVTATKGEGAAESIGHGNADSTVGTVTINASSDKVIQN